MRGHELTWLAAQIAKELQGSVGEPFEISTGMGPNKDLQPAIIVTTGVGIPLQVWETDDSASFRSRVTRHFDIRIVWPRLKDGREIEISDVLTPGETKKQIRTRINVGVTEPVETFVRWIREYLLDGAGSYYVRAVAMCAAIDGRKVDPPPLQIVK